MKLLCFLCLIPPPSLCCLLSEFHRGLVAHPLHRIES